MPTVTKAVSPQTRAKRRSENIAKGLIWSSAGLTIGILFFIIAFILVRGFYSSGTFEYEVVSAEERVFDGWALAANKRIRADELPFEKVSGIFSGEYIDWAKLSEQEYELRPIFPADAPEAAAALGIAPADLTPLAETYRDAEAALAEAAADPRAAVLIPASAADSLPKGVKLISVRRAALAAHPSVTKLVGNNILRALDEEQRERLFSGAVGNWKELGGLDLPIVLVVPPKDSPLYALLEKSGDLPRALLDGAAPSAARVVRAETEEAYLEALRTTEGAAGYRYWNQTKSAGLSLVRAQRVERGPNLTLPFLYEKPRMSGRVGGISTIIFNTVLMIVLTLAIATPIGVFAAIYLVEYAKQGKLVYILRLGTETLAGIPSIIFGLFGMLFFVGILGWGIGLFSGTLTITLMILPTIVRTSEEALKTVPLSLREGSLALGATKLQTIMKVAVPAASPGILTGVILAIGRAVGETAALIFTMGSSYEAAASLFSSARVLAVHVYLIVAEGIDLDRAFATASILVFIILGVNIAATRAIGRFNKMSGKQ